MNYVQLIICCTIISALPLQAQQLPKKSIIVQNNKRYPVVMIVQSNWVLCNQMWNDYGTNQKSWKRGFYTPINSVCSQATIPANGQSIYTLVDTPNQFPPEQGFTLYIWDNYYDNEKGGLFIHKNTHYGASLQYPNDFFPL